MENKRAVCLNCIDGRVQIPVLQWIKEHHAVDHVDLITEPGIDGLVADHDNPLIEIKRKVSLSIKANNASQLFVVGHHDCKANPVSDDIHRKQISVAVERLTSDFPDLDIMGLWVDSQWHVMSN